jgi:hypothetical protein
VLVRQLHVEADGEPFHASREPLDRHRWFRFRPVQVLAVRAPQSVDIRRYSVVTAASPGLSAHVRTSFASKSRVALGHGLRVRVSNFRPGPLTRRTKKEPAQWSSCARRETFWGDSFPPFPQRSNPRFENREPFVQFAYIGAVVMERVTHADDEVPCFEAAASTGNRMAAAETLILRSREIVSFGAENM